MTAAVPLARYGALSCTYFAGIGLFNPYAPLWFQSLGLSTLAIGAVSALQASTRVAGPYLWSWAGDHGGRRVELIRLAAAGALLSALALLGVRAAGPVALMATALFLANSGIVPLYEALLAQRLHTPTGIDPARYGRVRMWGSVGFIVSVSAFGVLLERAGIEVFPVFVAAMNALMLAAALRLPATRAEAVHAGPAPAVLPLLRRPEVAWFFASAFFTVLAHASVYTFLSLYLVQLGYGKAAVGALWAVGLLAEIGFFWKQGRWFPRLSAHRWLEAVAVVSVLRFAAIAGAAAWLPALVLAQAAHALSFAAHHAACITLVHRHFPGRLRGRGQALYTTLGYGLSGVAGGLGGGWLVSRLGLASVFWAAAGCSVVALGCARRATAHAARGAQPLAAAATSE